MATKENSQTRPLVGKVIGGIKGGAKRAALGDISNAAPTKVLFSHSIY
jgi:hypothetical protein